MSKFQLQPKSYLEIIYFIFFTSFFIIANRAWFFETDIILGHNWDFQFPYDHFSKKMNVASSYMWHDPYGNTNLVVTHYFINNAYVFLSNFLSTTALIKLIFFSVFLSAFYSMKFLLYRLTFSKEWAFLAGLLYAFSPFFFSSIIAGSLPQWFAYAFSPIYFYFLASYLSYGGRIKFIGVLISHFFIIIFLQYFLLISVYAFIFGIFFYRTEKLSYKEIIIRLSILSISFLLVNLYWIIPFLFQLGEFYDQIISNKSSLGAPIAHLNSEQSLFNIFFGTGFLDRNLYLNSLAGFEKIIFILSTSTILFITFFSAAERKINSFFIFFLSTFLIIAFLAKGGNYPFHELTLWIYNTFPIMKMFRSPQNIMFGTVFLLPILITLALYQSSKQRYYFVFFLSILTLIGWFNTGDIGHSSLSEQKKDSVDFYTINDDIKKIYENNTNRKLLHKELFFPSSYSIRFKENYNQSWAQGGVPEYYFLDNEGVFIEGVDDEKLLNLHKNIDTDFLKKNNIRYITIRNDVDYHHNYKLRNSFNYYDMKNYLDTSFIKVHESEYTSTYLVEDFLPAFYICSKHDYKFSYFENIKNGFCNIDSRHLPYQNYANKLIESNDKPFIEYAKVSPVEYRINIKGLIDSSLFTLRFFQKFDKNWYLIPLDKKRKIIKHDHLIYSTNINKFDSLQKNNISKYNLTNPEGGAFISKVFYNTVQNNNIIENTNSSFFSLEKFKIENLFHFPMDEYLIGRDKFSRVNGWLIDFSKLKENLHDYIYYNEDGTYDIEFKLIYYPQQLLHLGLLISQTFFLCIISLFIFLTFTAKRW